MTRIVGRITNQDNLLTGRKEGGIPRPDVLFVSEESHETAIEEAAKATGHPGLYFSFEIETSAVGLKISK